MIGSLRYGVVKHTAEEVNKKDCLPSLWEREAEAEVDTEATRRETEERLQKQAYFGGLIRQDQLASVWIWT